MRIYALGDIHGQLDMLKAAHDRIAADRARTGDADALVVHLGDYADRGPDVRGVLQFLVEGAERGEPWITLMGNHDRMFLDQLEDAPGAEFQAWTSPGMGGQATAESYGVSLPSWTFGVGGRRKLRRAVPDAHRTFLAGLPAYHETDHHIFVHAGIRPGLPIHEQINEDLFWIRHEFLDDPRDHGKLIVHGHTQIQKPEHAGNRVNLDTGAGFGRSLTAAVFEDREVWTLEATGRVPLLPNPAARLE